MQLYSTEARKDWIKCAVKLRKQVGEISGEQLSYLDARMLGMCLDLLIDYINEEEGKTL